jgi:uncharacterized protein YaeQ
MALKASILKAELQVSDMDRNHYDGYSLTLAQHPSETEERLMVRVLAFALNADPALVFGRGLSTEDEPDLWRKDLTGQIELWIELGQPDEARIRKACGRATQVRVYNYGGRAAALWWEKARAGLERCRNLEVFDVAPEASAALAALCQRNMSLQCFIQDGEVQLMAEEGSVDLKPALRERAG